MVTVPIDDPERRQLCEAYQVRRFIRVKYTFDAGDSVWLTPEGVGTGLNAATSDKKKVHEFKNKREVFSVLLGLGGRWMNGGRIVHVRAYPKVHNANG